MTDKKTIADEMRQAGQGFALSEKPISLPDHPERVYHCHAFGAECRECGHRTAYVPAEIATGDCEHLQPRWAKAPEWSMFHARMVGGIRADGDVQRVRELMVDHWFSTEAERDEWVGEKPIEAKAGDARRFKEVRAEQDRAAFEVALAQGEAILDPTPPSPLDVVRERDELKAGIDTLRSTQATLNMKWVRDVTSATKQRDEAMKERDEAKRLLGGLRFDKAALQKTLDGAIEHRDRIAAVSRINSNLGADLKRALDELDELKDALETEMTDRLKSCERCLGKCAVVGPHTSEMGSLIDCPDCSPRPPAPAEELAREIESWSSYTMSMTARRDVLIAWAARVRQLSPGLTEEELDALLGASSLLWQVEEARCDQAAEALRAIVTRLGGTK